jgi:CDP-diglyceride synthetase
MKTSNKKDWLHFITGAVAAVIISAAVAGVVKSSVNKHYCSCDCSSKFNLDDEIIYTMDVKEEISTTTVGEPPANPVILSQ